MFRRKQKAPAALGLDNVPARWQPALREIDSLATELRRLVGVAANGAVRDRLEEFEVELRATTVEIVQLAERGGAIVQLTQTLDIDAITSAYKRAKRDGADDADALERQHASAQRLLNSLEDVDLHVSRASMRAREVVLAAGELSLSGSAVALGNAQDSLMQLAEEASALRDAMQSLS